MKQEYNRYTISDFAVWERLFKRQVLHLQDKAATIYLDALGEIGFTATQIPDFRQVNRKLRSATGWQLEVVPGIVPAADFLELLRNRKFPASTWLRDLAHLDYLEEPDMFHDVFGHVPLLVVPEYCQFFTELAEIAFSYNYTTEVCEMLNRMYWFTIEFGLIREKAGLRIYGAGILSSFGESTSSIQGGVTHRPFDVKQILTTPFENNHIQDTYFIINEMEQLYASISQIKEVISDSTQHNALRA